MTVGELINHLSQFPDDTPVGYTEPDRNDDRQVFFAFDKVKRRDVNSEDTLVYDGCEDGVRHVVVLA